MIGKGKYDDILTKAREEAKAKSAILVIEDGEKGSSFCVQATLQFNLALPSILRDMADKIEADMKEVKF